MKWWNVIQLFNCVVYKKNRFWDLIETIILYTLMIENFFANDVVIYGTIFDLMLQSFLITRKLHLRIKWRIINSIIILEKIHRFVRVLSSLGKEKPSKCRSHLKSITWPLYSNHTLSVGCQLYPFFSEKLFNTSKCNFTPVNVTLPLTHSFL